MMAWKLKILTLKKKIYRITRLKDNKKTESKTGEGKKS